MKIQWDLKKNNIIILFVLCIIVLGSLMLLINFSSNAIAQYLNVNKPIDEAEVLLVEGWVDIYTLKFVKNEFSKGSYKYILISGMEGEPASGRNIVENTDSNASYIAQKLINRGIDSSEVKVAACHSTSIHRTFSMALAVRDWLNLNDPSIRRVNICTEYSHGRKTWSAYKRVLGDKITAGIFTFPKEQTPISQWFFKRVGFRHQMYSLLGYIYAALWPINLVSSP
jgi:hypothetical protein